MDAIPETAPRDYPAAVEHANEERPDRVSTPPRDLVLDALSSRLLPPFLVLRPTVRFPHAVIANGHYGLVAVVVRDDFLVKEEATNLWEGVKGRVDPEVLAMTQTLALAAAAQAPADRLAVVVWFPQGRGPSDGLVCASANPDDLAATIERTMLRRLQRSEGPMAPWIGAYAASAMLPPEEVNREMERMSRIIENVIEATAGGHPIIGYGMNFEAYDIADPRYFLPALLTAAHEDWSLVVSGGARVGGRRSHGGFAVSLEPDPTALVGYRVDSIRPSAIYMVLGAVVAAFKRCRTQAGEYHVTEVVEQFARFLDKKGLDATVIEDIDIKFLASEGDGQ